MAKGNCIDVSAWQGVIDWHKAKADGIEYAIIRAGHGITAAQRDRMFDHHIKGALAAGIKVGVYWFVYVNHPTTQQARANADACAAVIAGYKDQLCMPVWCDYEYDTDSWLRKNGHELSKDIRNIVIKNFISRMAEHGYLAGIYTNLDYINNYLNFGELEKYPLWLAAYNGAEKAPRSCSVWQYTSVGRIAGYPGNVDMDVVYTNYSSPVIEPDDPQPDPDGPTRPQENAKEYEYIVQKGDWLGKIAAKYGTTYRRIAADNQIENPDLIYPGQKLIIRV